MHFVFTELFLLAGLNGAIGGDGGIIIRPSYSLLSVIFYIAVYSIIINCELIKKYFLVYTS